MSIPKLENMQEINCPVISFLETFGNKKYNLPKICPDKITSLEVVEGNWGVKDAKLIGSYLVDGNEVISEETLEDLDEKNNSVTYNIHGGDMMKFYKTLKVTFQVTSDGDKNYVKSTYEYEKQNPEIPPPEQFKDFVAEIIKMVDEYHLNSELIKNNARDQA